MSCSECYHDFYTGFPLDDVDAACNCDCHDDSCNDSECPDCGMNWSECICYGENGIA